MIRRVAFRPVAVRLGVALLVGMVAGAPATAFAQDSTPGSGVFKTTEQVLAQCSSRVAADLERCDWFIMAAHDMMKFYGDTNLGGGKICIPTATRQAEVREAVLAAWRSNPATRKVSAVSTIYNGLTAKYPCP